jgi:hypothetical protein
MTSELPGNLRPGDFGAGEPGLEQLLTTLASGPAPGELAGEQAALAMFRANVPPPAPAPGGTRPMRQLRGQRLRSRRLGGRWLRGVRLGVISAAALAGGFTAAAYAAVLPAPVQHAAYQAFHAIGVPDSHPAKAAAGHRGAPSGTSPTGRPGSSTPAGRAHPKPSASGRAIASAAPKPSSTAKPKPSTSAGAPAGPVALSVQASSGQILAGGTVSLTGQVTAGGRPEGGAVVRLMEHVAGQPGWQDAQRATASAQGSVTFTVPSLTSNARFRLAAGGAHSATVIVTVVPGLSVNLTEGPRGADDDLAFSTVYARRGDVVVLQTFRGGRWVSVRDRLLGASGETRFVLKASKWQGDQLRVVLLATRRHARAVSSTVTVPPPG